jgi:hypothetical protein
MTTPSHHIIDHECRRLADALERLTVTLTERPDLAAMLDADGQTCADHLERLADFVTQAAKDYPEP